jgi:hypothetical protein
MVMSFLLFASIAKSYRTIISTFKVASTLFPETFCACIREQVAHFLIKNFCNQGTTFFQPSIAQFSHSQCLTHDQSAKREKAF